MIASPGIGSGLDINSIVAQLMLVERSNMNQMESKRTNYNNTISNYGELKNLIETVETNADSLTKLSELTVLESTLSNSSQFSVSLNESDANIGQHTIQVDQLALSHKISSAGFTSKDSSTSAAGTLSVSVGTDSFEITVDGSNDTLEGIRDSINNATDNTGVTATILSVTDEFGDPEYRLILTADDSGTDNAITLSDTSGNVASTLNSSTITAAQNAQLIVDGFNVERSTNVVDDVIEGVTLNLKQADNTATTLTISSNGDAVIDQAVEQVSSFVDSFNELIGRLDSLSANPNTNDGSLSLIKMQLRNIYQTASQNSGAFGTLIEIGISTAPIERLNSVNDIDFVSSGKLQLDETALRDALTSDFDSVATVWGDSTDGFATRFKQLGDDFTKFGGLIDQRTDILDDQLSYIGERIIREQARLDQAEKDLYAKFNRLDSIIAQSNATSDFLTQQLASIPLLGGKGSGTQQGG